MRLNLYWRGWDVIDVEVHAHRIAASVCTRRPDDDSDDGPTLRATGGGQAERADTYGDPATVASFGFCTVRPSDDNQTVEGRPA